MTSWWDLLHANGMLLNFYGDLRRVQQCVVDEAMMDGALDTGTVLIR